MTVADAPASSVVEIVAPTPPKPAAVAAGVAVAVAAVSAAAIFIRLADAPAIAIAMWRNVIACVVLGPALLATRGRMPSGKTLAICLASGVMLAGHFGLWISSLSYTSVAASVVLVCTQPIFVAVLARVLLKEHTSTLAWMGIIVAVVGTTLIGSDGSFGDSALLGNLLAVGGAITVAFYVLLGRVARGTGELGLLSYAVVVYATAGLTLFVVALATDTPLVGFSLETWGWIAAIGFGPQVLGHTLFNWALRWMKASVLSSTILIEPVVSTALAVVLLDEVPGVLTLIGGGVVLGGVALVIRGR